MTSSSLHVRLEVMVDGEHPERCGVCPKLRTYMGSVADCAQYGSLEWWVNRGRPNRHDRCLEATTADALNAAVVEAAKAWRDQNAPFDRCRKLIGAVDALRAERKEKR